jgi:Macrocin-O-methyltransferase (TylF)
VGVTPTEDQHLTRFTAHAVPVFYPFIPTQCLSFIPIRDVAVDFSRQQSLSVGLTILGDPSTPLLHGDAEPGTSMDTTHDLYLDLMMRALADWLYDQFDEPVRAEGLDWPARAHTMIGLKRLANVRACVESVLADGIPGDLIETGSWRGGTTIFMRAILKVHGVTDRLVWVADSFAGLPAPDASRYPRDQGDRYDGNVAGCRQAVHDFRAGRGINDPIQPIDWAGVYWRRSLQRSGARTLAEPLIPSLVP